MGTTYATDIGYGHIKTARMHDGAMTCQTWSSVTKQVASNILPAQLPPLGAEVAVVAAQGAFFIVGPGAHAYLSRSEVTRVPRPDYAQTPQYEALAAMALAMQPESTIDTWALSLPLSTLDRKKQHLEQTFTREWMVPDLSKPRAPATRRVRVAQACVIPQPYAAFSDAAATMREVGTCQNLVLFDLGFETLDVINMVKGASNRPADDCEHGGLHAQVQMIGRAIKQTLVSNGVSAAIPWTPNLHAIETALLTNTPLQFMGVKFPIEPFKAQLLTAVSTMLYQLLARNPAMDEADAFLAAGGGGEYVAEVLKTLRPAQPTHILPEA